MKYSVTVNGAEAHVDVDGENICIGTDAVRALLVETDGGPVRMLTLGERVYRVEVRPGDSRGRYTLWVEGFRFEVEALDERTRAIRELAAASARPLGPAPLVAPMPGMIIRVQVSEGDAV